MFEGMWSSMDAEAQAAARTEIHSLERRRRVCSWSITFCTAAAEVVLPELVALNHRAHRAVEDEDPAGQEGGELFGTVGLHGGFGIRWPPADGGLGF
jgi:hypothetical protein